LKTGDEVQLMQRSFDLKYIKSGIEEIRRSEQLRKLSFAFYINCAGRAKPYTGEEFEDAEEVQKGLFEIPFMGIYSGVEIAKINGKLQPLDWTGVLCMISE
jgi:small ligand-binding sensory domain FIST